MSKNVKYTKIDYSIIYYILLQFISYLEPLQSFQK